MYLGLLNICDGAFCENNLRFTVLKLVNFENLVCNENLRKLNLLI